MQICGSDEVLSPAKLTAVRPSEGLLRSGLGHGHQQLVLAAHNGAGRKRADDRRSRLRGEEVSSLSREITENTRHPTNTRVLPTEEEAT